MVHGLLKLHLGRSQPSVRTWWLCACLLSQEGPQVVAAPMPRKHAAMLNIDHRVILAQVHRVMAAAWRRACAASAPRRPAPPPGCSSQRPSTCGLMVHGLLRLHLGRSQPLVCTLWLVCQCPEPGGAAGRCRSNAAQARRHAASHASKHMERAGAIAFVMGPTRGLGKGPSPKRGPRA